MPGALVHPLSLAPRAAHLEQVDEAAALEDSEVEVDGGSGPAHARRQFAGRGGAIPERREKLLPHGRGEGLERGKAGTRAAGVHSK